MSALLYIPETGQLVAPETQLLMLHVPVHCAPRLEPIPPTRMKFEDLLGGAEVGFMVTALKSVENIVVLAGFARAMRKGHCRNKNWRPHLALSRFLKTALTCVWCNTTGYSRHEYIRV